MWPNRSTYSAPIRYFLVVCCGFFVDLAIYSGLVAAGLSIYFANVLAFLVGTTVNVLLIRRFVFTDNRFGLGHDVLFSTASNGIMLGFGMCLLGLFVEVFGWGPYVSKVLSNGVTFVINYLVRLRIFRKG